MIKEKKKLLVVTNVYPLPWQPTRGTYNKIQLDNIANEFDIRVIVPIPFPEWLKNNTKHNDKSIRYAWQCYLPVIGAPINGLLLFLSVFINSFFWIKKFSPDLLLTCWSYPDGLAGCLLAKILKIPFFLKVHGSDVNIHCQFPSRRKQIVWLANNAKKVICVSNALSKKLISCGVKPEKTVVIYNGVDKTTFAPTNCKPYKRVLFVGNIKRSKGVFEALEGFANLADNFSEHNLTFIGDGPDLIELEKKVKLLSLSSRVTFLGAISHSEIANVLKQSHVLLLPSHAEGVPNVVLEAMSCGIPSVATAVGGIPEILENGVNGFIIDKIDSKLVTESLEKALLQPWDKNIISKYANDFDWHKNAKQLKELLLSNCK